MLVTARRNLFEIHVDQRAAAAAKRLASTAIRPVFERPDERRRQGDIWRRPRIPHALIPSSDGGPAPAGWTETLAKDDVPPDFWSLVAAVATQAATPPPPGLASMATSTSPSFDDLLTQAVKPLA